MNNEELEIVISPTGQITVKTKGIKGKACLDVTNAIVALLGRESSRELTAEFYENQVEVRSEVQQKLSR